MKVLGIESTAHTLGFGIFGEGVILDLRASYATREGGFVPSEVFRHHCARAPELLEKVLQHDFEAVAWSKGPGIGTVLRVGSTLARFLAKELELPIVGVNHVLAHLEIAKHFTRARDPLFVFVSGANTQIIASAGSRYRVFGETLDIGLGNLLDKVARALGIGFPGGPEIERLARDGSKFIELPYTVKGMDLTFSGLYTAVTKLVGKERAEDIAFSLQEVAFAMLVEASERALAHCKKDELLLTGGVAQNRRLQEMLKEMCQARGVKFKVCPKEYCGDNGVMIALLGKMMIEHGIKGDLGEAPKPRWRVDQVDVPWLKP